MSYRILVTEAMSEDGPDWLRANGYEVKYGRGTDEKTLIEDLQDCDGVIPRLAVMSDAVISACPRLKVIARHGSGVDTVDLESCRRHGVRVVNTRGSNSVAVAEHAMLLVGSPAPKTPQRPAGPLPRRSVQGGAQARRRCGDLGKDARRFRLRSNRAPRRCDGARRLWYEDSGI